MDDLDAGELYLLLKRGSGEERLARFAHRLPAGSANRQIFAELESPYPLVQLRALRSLLWQLKNSYDPPDFAKIAIAAHRFGAELAGGHVDGYEPLMLVELGEFANMLVDTQMRTEQFREVVEFTREWIPTYRKLQEQIYLENGTLGLLEHYQQQAMQRILAEQHQGQQEQEPSPGPGPGPRPSPPGGGFSDSMGVSKRPASPPKAAAPAGHTSAKPVEPPAQRRPVSTGFASRASPSVPRPHEVLTAQQACHFWLEIDQVVGSIEERATSLPTELLPAKARLCVVVFTPDDGLTISATSDTGELELQADGRALVIRQPGASEAPGTPARRLLFPLTAGAPGPARLRCSIYCHGVLVQSRIVSVAVGGTERRSRVDFTLATRIEAAELAALPEHRFSMHINESTADMHDFYIHGDVNGGAYNKSIRISAQQLEGPLKIARAGLRRASWGDEEPWSSNKQYRYQSAPKLEQIRLDLAILARCGRRVFDAFADELRSNGLGTLEKIEAIVAKPGLVQITSDASIGTVLPAALIYDYPFSMLLEAAEFTLCPEFQGAIEKGKPLAETACFNSQCPSRGKKSTVCPSGFWGFRHSLGLPISCIEAEDPELPAKPAPTAGIAARIAYEKSPVLVVGVSRSPDLPLTGPHTKRLLGLRPDWGATAWKIQDNLVDLLTAMREQNPHLVYMYCHGTMREVENKGFPMLFFGSDPRSTKSSDWFEKAMLRSEDVAWSRPRPLVFLNGCRTTMLNEDTTLNFVRGFVQTSGACGVIGTEITVFETLADEFATAFLRRFLAGEAVGDAVRAARLDLLQKGNPLGLVYTPFVLSGTQLVQEK